MIKMAFVDRAEELQFLQEQYKQKESSLVIIYGRRRTGKTTLIQKFIEDKPALYFLATEESERENIQNLKQLMASFSDNELLAAADGLGWMDIFRIFAKTTSNKRQILVIDEFQYLCTANSAFASILQKIWDTLLKELNVMVILCGSLISMMHSQTLSYSSPLYGRRTGQLRLRQIPFRDYGDFFPGMLPDQQIQYYAVTGGVPRYIEAFKKDDDLLAEIEKNILSRQSFLYEEPVFLLEKEVGEIGTYFSIIKTIAAGNHKLGKIAAVLEVPQSHLTKYLSTLIQIDLVERKVPVTVANPQKSKKGLYFITDNFISFWFRFVYPYRSSLEIGDTAYVLEKLRQEFIPCHVAYVYEGICTELLWQMSREGKLPFKLMQAGPWWDNHDEIDIIGLNHETGDIAFCECKYTGRPIGIEVLHQLQKKASRVKWRQKQRRETFVLFSRSGYQQELLDLANEQLILC